MNVLDEVGQLLVFRVLGFAFAFAAAGVVDQTRH